jgi:acetyl-CoA carboxylase biotin carboxyl carrier protein
MELEKLQELIRLFESSSISELEIEEEGKRITLRKPQPAYTSMPTYITHAPAPQQPAAPVFENKSPLASQSPPEPAKAPTPEEEGLETIDSPMVGVFYAAPAPGEAPFVKPGDTIEDNQTLCVVEAMKLMNEVTAKFRALIVKVLVENGEAVEFGQPMFAVRRI